LEMSVMLPSAALAGLRLGQSRAWGKRKAVAPPPRVSGAGKGAAHGEVANR